MEENVKQIIREAITILHPAARQILIDDLKLNEVNTNER